MNNNERKLIIEICELYKKLGETTEISDEQEQDFFCHVIKDFENGKLEVMTLIEEIIGHNIF